jgi:putative flavoprotein involved in K+ transport
VSTSSSSEVARRKAGWSERWDSLTFQFPSSSIQLPGFSFETDDPDGYVPKYEIVRFIERNAALIDAPLHCNCQVVALRSSAASDRLQLDTEHGMIEVKHVVVATGPFQTPHIPAFGASLPVDIFQVHSRDYRNPRQLPSGAVLVVGSGASGCQIAEELHQAGRKVFLSVGQFHKTPRRYRGRDIYWWFEVLGIWHRPLELQPEVRNLRHPLSTFRQASRSWLVTQYWVSQYFGSLDVVPHDYRSRQSEPLPL